MSKSVTIREVPDDVVAELASRAAAGGRSLQEYLRAHLVEVAARPDPVVWVARLHARKTATGSRLDAAEIVAARDADRR